jgi:dipeptidyl aminopeptidase/acylaminoacyl peptidase
LPAAILAYLTLPPGSDGKPGRAIVMPHGGPSARDEWGFDWLVQYFVVKSYVAVRHSREMAKALKGPGTKVLYQDYDMQHDIGDTIARSRMLSEIGKFLDKALSNGE